jgi:hypothetical protein
VNISLRSQWYASEFRVGQIRISHVDALCTGQDLYLDLLDSSGNYLVSLSIPAVVVSPTGEVLISSRDYPDLTNVRSESVDRVLIEFTSM